MEKKYQVFVSSTYADLIEERKKVQEVLLMADCIPAGMEAFVATDDNQFNVIKQVIDLCDYYILIIGKRYGSINPDTGISYTEMEYKYAKEKEIPVLVFCINDDLKLSSDKMESNPESVIKLIEFRNTAMSNTLASIWNGISDIGGQVAISIMKAKNTVTRPGWIRGEGYNPEEFLQQINELKKENQQLIEINKKNMKEIDSFTSIPENLAFEDYELKVQYKIGYESSFYTKTVTLKEIFKYLSIAMHNVTLSEDYIVELVGKCVSNNTRLVTLKDNLLVNILLNQFEHLNLIYSKWNDENKKLYYGLTTKGKKVKDDFHLIKK
ncbi:MAG: DUF4062 domain-containing protein [Firmicutes bacterium]|nr:DUF4062 domain-containing protein [Bacillota bacterium]